MSLSDLHRYELRRPASLTEACRWLSEPGEPAPVLLAGGTDLYVRLAQSPPSDEPVPAIIDISRLAELREISFHDGSALRIGAACTFLELQRHPEVCRRLPLLAAMSRDLGGVTIQARATLGGNLATASPAADGVCALAALDGVIEVASTRGRRRIPLAELQTGYKQSTRATDEVIVAVELPLPSPEAAWIWRKVGPRRAQAISKVALAAVAEVEHGSVRRFGAAMAAVAPVTALMTHTRTLVQGGELALLTTAKIDAAVDADIAPIDDVRSTKQYRTHCARAIMRAFLRDLGAPC